MPADRVNRAARSALTRVAFLAALLAIGGAPVSAQSTPRDPDTTRVHGTIFERLSLDRLRFEALGFAVGAIRPSKAEATGSYTVLADYGEVVPGWRVLFTATYWNSHIKQHYLDVLADTLRNSISDPTGDYTLDVGRVRLSDIALVADVQYAPPRFRLGPLKPYVGGGFGAHVVNAEGSAINGTIVEQSLDNITSGLAVMAGVDLAVLRNFSAGAQARFDLLSAARFASLRAVGTYVFDSAPRRRR